MAYSYLLFDSARDFSEPSRLLAEDFYAGDEDSGLSEMSFPVVELAMRLSEWLQLSGRGDFVFETPVYRWPQVLVLHEESEGWRVTSNLSCDVAGSLVPEAALLAAVSEFLQTVQAELGNKGIDLFLTLHARWA